jgi:hypothetical protein
MIVDSTAWTSGASAIPAKREAFGPLLLVVHHLGGQRLA